MISEQDIIATYSGKKVLITGGAGFIGSALAHALVAVGAEVTILDAMLPLYGGNMFNLRGIENDIEFIEGDIRDEELVEKVVAGKDFIFDFAAQVSHIDSKDQPLLDLDINGRGHLLVLEAVRKHAPHAKVLFSSSRMVYGKILSTPVDETHPTQPLSIYGVHKVLAEMYYRYYFDVFNTHTIIARLPTPYGPRAHMKHPKYSVVNWFLRQSLDGETIKIFGDGTQSRDYIYIDDVVDAFLRLGVGGTPGEIYNLGTTEKMRLVDMVDAILLETKTGSKEHVPYPDHYVVANFGDYIANYDKIRTTVAWEPQISLEEGVRKMVAYYAQHRKFY
ncbi:MAG: NAD-dependent epimerase/dehydratase family protein [Minisyncoccia bacterium]